MNNASLNYTPLNDSPVSKKSFNVKSFMGLNFLAFLIAMGIVGYMYFNRQVTSQTQTTSAQASGSETYCQDNQIQNPSIVTASVEGIEREIDNGEVLNTDSITFTWDPAVNAEFYYVYLHEVSRKPNEIVDPAESGIINYSTSYTFEDLDPNQTYHLYIRTKGVDDTLGMVFPTPGNCDVFIPAKPIFYFKTAAT